MNISLPLDMYSKIQASMPKFTTRSALVVQNMQNDSFSTKDGYTLCTNQEFRQVLADMVPYFRYDGDVVWVRTEHDHTPVSSTSVSRDQAGSLQRDGQPPQLSASPNLSPMPIAKPASSSSSPFMGSRSVVPKTTPRSRYDTHKIDLESLDINDDPEAYLKKPRKGETSPSPYTPGTTGAECTPEVQSVMDTDSDMIITTSNYSAFDGTPLLMSLRMKLVTHIYLAGCLSNVSIYATAADAVQHGFEVTVVEDCLGYRSEPKHIEAMRSMADMLGVHGIDSQEIIEEAQKSKAKEMSIANGTIPDTAQLNSQRMPSSVGADNAVDGPIISASTENNFDSSRPAKTDRPQGCGAGRVKGWKKAIDPPLGPQDKVGEGDSSIILDALSHDLREDVFKTLFHEVDWQVMKHRNGEVPRRVAVQGETGPHGAVPLYRHPADESPPFLDFTPTVRKIRDELQILLKQPFNHCLIQLYRNGQDNISEHSDKTLDIVRGSSIINLSLGAQRTMTLRSKKETAIKQDDAEPKARNIQRIPMPHNSVFVLGWTTNAKWLHGVRADKRLLAEKSEAELAYDGQRISLTFRNIGTFTNRARTKIWGQGAKSKTEATAGDIITANSPEMDTMINSFGMENHLTDFDWDAHYGGGFDVLNLLIADSSV